MPAQGFPQLWSPAQPAPMPISEIAGLCSDQLQTHVEAWVCDQPPKDQAYRVVRDRWVEGYTVRLILEVEAYEVVPVGSGG